MATKLYLDVINLSGHTLTQNSLVYISGFDPGTGLYTVDYASYDSPTANPTIGALNELLFNGQVGTVKVQGIQTGIDTSLYPTNTVVFLGLNGNLSFQNPSIFNPLNIVQEIGIVVVSSTNGAILFQSSYANEVVSSGSGIVGSGLPNRLSYWESTTGLTYANSLYFDGYNLAINTTSILADLTVRGDAYFSGTISSNIVDIFSSASLPAPVSNNGQLTVQPDGNLYFTDSYGTSYQITPATGTGTVTSVGLSVPTSIFSISGPNPIVSLGTFDVTLNNQNANLFFGSPVSGLGGIPDFRSIQANDLPSISSLNGNLTLSKISTSGANSGQVITYNGTNAVWSNANILGSGSANQISYWSNTNTLTGSNNLWFNGSQVGINTNNPQSALDVSGTIRQQGLQYSTNYGDGYLLQTDFDGYVNASLTSSLGTLPAQTSYDQVTYNGILVSRYTIWTNSSMTQKIRDEFFTYDQNNNLLSSTINLYNSIGNISRTLVENYNYINNNITTIQRNLT